jgi:hypothetical protein
MNEDIRIETAGQWTRGTCIVDRRGKVVRQMEGDIKDEVIGDAGGWLDSRRGNRVDRCAESPGPALFAEVLMKRVFGDTAS